MLARTPTLHRQQQQQLMILNTRLGWVQSNHVNLNICTPEIFGIFKLTLTKNKNTTYANNRVCMTIMYSKIKFNYIGHG